MESYAIGGRILGDGVRSEDMDERISDFNRVEMYNPVTDSWSIATPMLRKGVDLPSSSE